MKKLLILAGLILAPSLCFADRLGSIRSGAEVMLSTQGVQVNPSGVQSGAFNIAGGSITANQGQYWVGSGGAGNSQLSVQFIPLPRSGGFGPQAQEGTLYYKGVQSSGQGGFFQIVAATIPQTSVGVAPTSSNQGNFVSLIFNPMSKFINTTVNDVQPWIVNDASSTFAGNLVLSAYNCSGNANDGKLTVDANGLVTCADDVSGGGGGGTTVWSKLNGANLDTAVSSINVVSPLTATSSPAGQINLTVNTTSFMLSESSMTFLTVASGATTYLTQSSATATYLQNSSASVTYAGINVDLSKSSATATYLQNSSATATYVQFSSAVANYISISSVAANYPSVGPSITLNEVGGGVAGANAYDFGGATSVKIPNGASPTVDETGEIGMDTTDSVLVAFDGSTTTVIAYTTHTYIISFASGAWTSLAVPVFTAPVDMDITITKVFAETMPAASTVTYQLNERINAGTSGNSSLNTAGVDVFNVNYSTANGVGHATTTGFSNPRIAAGSSLVLTTPAGTASAGNPTFLKVTLSYKRERD